MKDKKHTPLPWENSGGIIWIYGVVQGSDGYPEQTQEQIGQASDEDGRVHSPRL